MCEDVSQYEIKRYVPAEADLWNRFVDNSRQGTFLLRRDYMDYHSHRFHDHSLMIYHGHRLVALLPAHEEETLFCSHKGLTYAGLVTDSRATTAEVCHIFESINSYLRACQFSGVVYKAIPAIYHKLPAEEDLYALTNVCNARLVARHVSSALSPHRLRFAESRKSGIRKARREGVVVCEDNDLERFWHILDDNLFRQYGAHPVHSLAELRLLQSCFPHEIRLFMAYLGTQALGGTLIYETPQVVHTQYISATAEGKAVGALDALFDYLLNVRYADVPWFDFGKSSNGDGHELNQSLIFQKEGFGGRAVCYDWYAYDL